MFVVVMVERGIQIGEGITPSMLLLVKGVQQVRYPEIKERSVQILQHVVIMEKPGVMKNQIILKLVLRVHKKWIFFIPRHNGRGIFYFHNEIRQIKPDIFFVNEDGHSDEKQKFIESLGIRYIVSKRQAKENLPIRSTTSIRQSINR